MDIINLIDSQTLMFTTASVAFICACVMIYCIHKQNKLLMRFNKLSDELNTSNRSAIGMGQQIIALEKKIDTFDTPKQALSSDNTVAPAIDLGQFSKALAELDKVAEQKTNKPPEPITQNNPQNPHEKNTNDKLNLARELLAKGDALSDVASQCELSFAEVSLLRALSATSSSATQQSPPR